MKKFIGLLLILCLFNFLLGLGGGADTAEFPDIYIDEGVGGTHVGSIANPYDDFADINWTTGGDNSIFDWYAGAEDASVTINLMEGDEWLETLTVGASGSATYPIIIKSYGAGAKPIINGADEVETWTEAAAPVTETWGENSGDDYTTVTEDFYMKNNDPDVNYNPQLVIKSDLDSFIRRSLIRFDVSAISDAATINTAVLKLTMSIDNGENYLLILKVLQKSWTEAVGTWNDYLLAGCCLG